MLDFAFSFPGVVFENRCDEAVLEDSNGMILVHFIGISVFVVRCGKIDGRLRFMRSDGDDVGQIRTHEEILEYRILCATGEILGFNALFEFLDLRFHTPTHEV